VTEEEFQEAANLLQCEAAAVKAVAEVESSKYGAFVAPGKATILFEPHIFCRYTNGRYNQSYPHLSYPKWKPGAYGPVSKQWGKFEEAAHLDGNAAIQSCSWGMFQIMGFNHKKCGYEYPDQYKDGMCRSEGEQLQAFCRYIKAAGLADELQSRDWPAFARQYNGPAYAKNKYDLRLAGAFEKFSKL
jgi:hypothetical protein